MCMCVRGSRGGGFKTVRYLKLLSVSYFSYMGVIVRHINMFPHIGLITYYLKQFHLISSDKTGIQLIK